MSKKSSEFLSEKSIVYTGLYKITAETFISEAVFEKRQTRHDFAIAVLKLNKNNQARKATPTIFLEFLQKRCF
jgi:hypothetical protein